MSWDNFKNPAKDWGVTWCDANIDGMSTGDILQFEGDGDGTDDSKVTAAGADWGYQCHFDDSSGTDIVKGMTLNQTENFHFIITRSGTNLECVYDDVYENGDPLWKAQEGG